MTVTISVQETNGQFCAGIPGSPTYQVVRATREEAIQALQTELSAKVAAGELVDIDVRPMGALGVAGIFRDDPTLQGLVNDIYRLRDEEPRQ